MGAAGFYRGGAPEPAAGGQRSGSFLSFPCSDTSAKLHPPVVRIGGHNNKKKRNQARNIPFQQKWFTIRENALFAISFIKHDFSYFIVNFKF